jgi:MYXO-CTERM domain-containing protein
MKLRTLALAGAMTIFSSAAHAHFNLVSPPASSMTTEGGKGAPPCGPDSPSANPMKVQGGHPLPIKIVETIFHPGHYRIALAMNSPSELPKDPPVVAPGNVSMSTTIQMPAVFPVLADGVFAHTNSTQLTFQMDLMLPNVTCAKCTLQVIEFMRDHGPNPGGGYFYHHCADLQITADPALPSADGGAGASPDASAADSGAGGADSSVADTSTMGTGGTGGAGGTGGGGGSAGGGGVGGGGGTTIGGGGGTGGAGDSGTGTGGTTGGAAGSGGAAGTGGKSSGGGCTVGDGSPRLSGALGIAILGLMVVARRRRRMNRP